MTNDKPFRQFRFIPASDLDPVRDRLLMLEAGNKPMPSNRELSYDLGWSESRTSRFVDELISNGQAFRRRAGKSVSISLI